MAKLDLDVLTIKTGTTADIKMSDKVLQKGELLADTNSGNPQLYVGDGTTKVKNLKGIGGYTLPKLYWADQEVSLSKSTMSNSPIPSFGGLKIVTPTGYGGGELTTQYLYINDLGQPTNYINNGYINNINTNKITVGSSGSITIGGTKIKSGNINTPTLDVTQNSTFGVLGDNYTCKIIGTLNLNDCTVEGFKIGSGSSFAGFKTDKNSIWGGDTASTAWTFWQSNQTGTVANAFYDWYNQTSNTGWLFRVGNNNGGFGIRSGVTVGYTGYYAVASRISTASLYAYEIKTNKIEANEINGQVQTPSDKQLKKDISSLNEKYDTLFNNLQPVSFKYKDGHRTHVGFIAQDVKEAMDKANISNEDFAAYCEDKKDSDVECSLRYSEFIAINTMQIKKLKDEVKELKEQINKLTKTRKKKEVTE